MSRIHPVKSGETSTGSGPGTVRPKAAGPAAESRQADAPEAIESGDPDRIREQIELTRTELAGTVKALAAKTDVQGRAKGKAARLRAQAGQRARTGAGLIRQRTAPVVQSVRARSAAHAAVTRQSVVAASGQRRVQIAAGVAAGVLLWRRWRRG